MSEEKTEELDLELKETQDKMNKVLKNREDDYEYSRENLYHVAERLNDILDTAIETAQESGHPRAIEVATNTASALADLSKKMMDHHIQTEKLNNPNGSKTERVTNNLNLKLNTTDLLKMLKEDD
jgi:hypothetical protein